MPATLPSTPASGVLRVQDSPAQATQKPAQPGELPADTAPEAAALWRSLCATTRTPAAPDARPPGALRAFDLSFDQRLRSGAQRDEFAARVRYLAPGFLRFRLESGREQMRGPTGDWLVDGDEAVRLRGREHAEDRRQMDDWLAVAGNFVSLSDPASLHINHMALVDKAPTPLPPQLADAAQDLRWLSVESPVFRLFLNESEDHGRQTLFSAYLGLDPGDSSLSLAVLHDIELEKLPAQGPGSHGHRARTLLIQVLDQRPLDGYIIPRLMNIHQWLTDGFERRPSMELFVVDGRLGGELDPTNFAP